MLDKNRNYLKPNWPAHSGIQAFSTTRVGGVGARPYDTFNLGLHVGDETAAVKQNRDLLKQDLKLPDDPVWMEQVHSTDVIYVDQKPINQPIADAAYTDKSGIVLAVMSADCLPVLFASRCGSVVAAAHAGWRGLAGGVLQNVISRLPVEPGELMAWMGPAIGQRRFEVGSEVLKAFELSDAGAGICFTASHMNRDKFVADLYGLAERVLQSAEVKQIYKTNQCTFIDQGQFFSHRRDSGQTGRMASLIWKS